MHESNPRETVEITAQQAEAFIEAIKAHLPVLEPQVFMAEELVATWMSVNPNADPQIAKQAFKDHIGLSAHSEYMINNTLIHLNHHETDDDTSTDLRVMQMLQLEEDCLIFSSWMRIVNGKPVFTRSIDLMDRLGNPTETPVDTFLAKAEAKEPGISEIYNEFMQKILAPDANVFDQQVLADAMRILEQLSPETKLPAIEDL